jgi:hypothetical protein
MSSPFVQPNSRSFEARYPGICETCGEDFEVGSSIMYDGDDLIHADNSECMAFRDRPIRKPCTTCFLVHAGECF